MTRDTHKQACTLKYEHASQHAPPFPVCRHAGLRLLERESGVTVYPPLELAEKMSNTTAALKYLVERAPPYVSLRQKLVEAETAMTSRETRATITHRADTQTDETRNTQLAPPPLSAHAHASTHFLLDRQVLAPTVLLRAPTSGLRGVALVDLVERCRQRLVTACDNDDWKVNTTTTAAAAATHTLTMRTCNLAGPPIEASGKIKMVCEQIERGMQQNAVRCMKCVHEREEVALTVDLTQRTGLPLWRVDGIPSAGTADRTSSLPGAHLLPAWSRPPM